MLTKLQKGEEKKYFNFEADKDHKSSEVEHRTCLKRFYHTVNIFAPTTSKASGGVEIVTLLGQANRGHVFKKL